MSKIGSCVNLGEQLAISDLAPRLCRILLSRLWFFHDTITIYIWLTNFVSETLHREGVWKLAKLCFPFQIVPCLLITVIYRSKWWENSCIFWCKSLNHGFNTSGRMPHRHTPKDPWKDHILKKVQVFSKLLRATKLIRKSKEEIHVQHFLQLVVLTIQMQKKTSIIFSMHFCIQPINPLLKILSICWWCKLNILSFIQDCWYFPSR